VLREKEIHKMPYTFIRKLLGIFNLKEEILEQLKKLVDPIDEIVHDFGKVWEDKYEDMVLKHHPFHEDTGFLPLVTKLIQANDELVHYQDDKDTVSIKDEFGVNMSENLAHCGLEIHREYLRMMALVKQERFYLVKWFMPTLKQIRRREDYREAWKQHLEHFGVLVDVLENDLKFADILQESLGQRGFLDYLKKPTKEEIEKNKPIIVNNVVKSFEQNDFNGAVYWIKYGRNHEWLDEDETSFLEDVITAVKKEDIEKLHAITSNKSFTSLFNESEKRFFIRFLEQIKAKKRIEKRKEIKNQIIEAIKKNNFEKISDLISDREITLLFSQDEITFLINLVNAVATKDTQRLGNLISQPIFNQFFDAQDANFFRQLLEQIEHERIGSGLSGLGLALNQGQPNYLERMRQERAQRDTSARKEIPPPEPLQVTLPQELRLKLEQAKAKLEEYLGIVNSIYDKLPEGDVKEEWRSAISKYISKWYDSINLVLQGKSILSEDVKSYVKDMTYREGFPPIFKDINIILIDTLIVGNRTPFFPGTFGGLGVEFLDTNPDVNELITKLLNLIKMKIILARSGGEVDYQTMQHEYSPSRNPRVSYVIQPGYYYAGHLYRKATVRVM